MNLAILGLGTVGCGIVENIIRNNNNIYNKTGQKINISQVLVRDKNKKRSDLVANTNIVEDFSQIINNKDIDIIIEVMGGIEPAKTYITQALINKKNVITANKDLLAMHGNELLEIAKQNNVALFFEASVAGGIPIIRNLKNFGDDITAVIGIINGTSNYILSKIDTNQQSFANALKQAQRLGYAEADPISDVEGLDTAYKISILSSIAFGVKIDGGKTVVQGISDIELVDIQLAKQFNFTVKHLGVAKIIENKINVRVNLFLIPNNHILSKVNGVMNAVLVKSKLSGDSIFYGAGAGAEATASAIMSDVVELSKNTNTLYNFGWNKLNNIDYDCKSYDSDFYIRFILSDDKFYKKTISTVKKSLMLEEYKQQKIESKEFFCCGYDC